MQQVVIAVDVVLIRKISCVLGWILICTSFTHHLINIMNDMILTTMSALACPSAPLVYRIPGDDLQDELSYDSNAQRTSLTTLQPLTVDNVHHGNSINNTTVTGERSSVDINFVSPNSVDDENYSERQITSLKDILLKDAQGRVVLQSYEQNNVLKNTVRNLLSRCIILNEIRCNPGIKRIEPERYLFLANAIVELFPPKEKPGLWYFSAAKTVGNRKKVVSGGKLYNTFRHLISNHKKQVDGSSKATKNNTNKGSLNSNASEGIDEDTQKQLTFLKTNKIPYDTVLNYWMNTFNKRREILSTLSIGDYVKQFAVLSITETARILYRIDFNCLFANKNLGTFGDLWRPLRPKLIELIVAEISRPKHSDGKKSLIEILKNVQQTADAESTIDGIILTHLPLVFKPVTLKRKHDSTSVRPSSNESQNSFILHVENPSDLRIAVAERKEALRKAKRTFQPTPVFTGEVTRFSSYYVALNEELFCVEGPLEAIELTFHLFFALNAEYPTESKLVWQLLQRGIYGIELESDIGSVTFSRVLSDLC